MRKIASSGIASHSESAAPDDAAVRHDDGVARALDTIEASKHACLQRRPSSRRPGT
jgi:hypothetical protein